MQAGRSQRSFPRYSCSGAAEIFQNGTRCGWGKVSEIGSGGCYVETEHTLAAGTAVQIRVTMAALAFETAATIAWTTPQVGMGVRFEASSAEAKSMLAQLIRSVSGDTPAQSSSAPISPPAITRTDPQGNARPGSAISPEAAFRILTRIVQRVRQSGSLTEQEILEIVNANR